MTGQELVQRLRAQCPTSPPDESTLEIVKSRLLRQFREQQQSPPALDRNAIGELLRRLLSGAAKP